MEITTVSPEGNVGSVTALEANRRRANEANFTASRRLGYQAAVDQAARYASEANVTAVVWLDYHAECFMINALVA